MRVAGAQRGPRRPRRRRRRAQPPVLHHAHVVQQKTYLSLEGRVGLIVKRGVRGRERGRRRRHERGQLALEQGHLALERGDARFLGLEHSGERGARAAAREPSRGQRTLQLRLQRPQRVRRRLELLPVSESVSRRRRPPPPDAATAAPLNIQPTYDRRRVSCACWGCVPVGLYSYCELAATVDTNDPQFAFDATQPQVKAVQIKFLLLKTMIAQLNVQ